jgi:hypothetical protein
MSEHGTWDGVSKIWVMEHDRGLRVVGHATALGAVAALVRREVGRDDGVANRTAIRAAVEVALSRPDAEAMDAADAAAGDDQWLGSPAGDEMRGVREHARGYQVRIHPPSRLREDRWAICTGGEAGRQVEIDVIDAIQWLVRHHPSMLMRAICAGPLATPGADAASKAPATPVREDAQAWAGTGRRVDAEVNSRSVACLTNPNVDLDLALADPHRHEWTGFLVYERATTGWRVTCKRCDKKLGRFYQDTDEIVWMIGRLSSSCHDKPWCAEVATPHA